MIQGIVRKWQKLKTVWRARNWGFEPVPCPGCGSHDPLPLLRADRYLLPFETSCCRKCGLVYGAKALAGTRLLRFYQQDYRVLYESVETIDARYLHESKDELKAATRWLRIREHVPKVDAVLEIGCGLGFFLKEALRQGAREVVGLEPGETFHAFASQAVGPNGRVLNAGWAAADLGSFHPDLVVAFHVLEHMENPKACLAWIRERISPQGTLVIEVPNIKADWSILGLRNFHLAHLVYFSPETLRAMLFEAGFQVTSMVTEAVDGIFPGNLRVLAVPSEVGAGAPSGKEFEADLPEFVFGQLDRWSRGSWLRRVLVRWVWIGGHPNGRAQPGRVNR